MRPTPISREIIDRAIDEYGIIDYANAARCQDWCRGTD